MNWISGKRHLCIVAIVLSAIAQGQSPEGAAQSAQKSTSVPFFVNNPHDRPVSTVGKNDIRVIDEKYQAKVLTLAKGTEIPLRLVLLLDASNSESVSTLYQPALKAAWNLMSQVLVGPDDKVAIVKFSSKPESPTQFLQRTELQNYKLDVRFGGASALQDAVRFACESRMDTDNTKPYRRVIILLSDGDDNSSQSTKEEAIAAALGTGTVLFVVSTREHQLGWDSNKRSAGILRDLAEKTGGKAFLDLGLGNLDQSFSKITEQIQNMYVVTFDAPVHNHNGFHSIGLELVSPGKARVRVPQGYYAK